MPKQKRMAPDRPSADLPALAPYRSKRDFTVTREPQGANGAGSHSSAALPFVIQKHAASQLHYDFRLGWKGVLKSWAVTKGPSYFPGDKRLAVQVEDHPWDYKDFEGTIPKGQYGGGTVMVWDQGTWEPHGDVDRGLEEGHLKFELHGTKLKGNWALIRMNDHAGRDTNGRAGKDRKSNWLLIKEHDKYERSQKSPSITEEAGLSVVTKRSLEQIAAQDGPVWDSTSGRHDADGRKMASNSAASELKPKQKRNTPMKPPVSVAHAPRERFPGFIAPQLAQPAREAPEGADWLHELKMDGYRIQIHIQCDQKARPKARSCEVKLLTRKNLDWSRRMPAIAAAAAQLPVEDAIIDGETVALDDKGIANFADLQTAFQEGKNNELTYVGFDLLHLDGRNLRGLPFLERKKLLAELLRGQDKDSAIRFSEHLEAHGPKVFAEACRLGAEGIVSKLASASYTSGRAGTWLKVKCFQEQELVIGGFTPRSNDIRGIGALLLGYYDDGKLRYAGRTGTGLSQQTQRDLRKRLDQLSRKNAAFADVPREALRHVRWVDPVLVAQITFSNWTRDNLVRQAAFKGLREDKPAEEVVREIAVTPAAASKPSVVRGKKTTGKENISHGKRSPEPANRSAVVITHPDKVLDETSGMTKQDLADYYAAISSHILTYIADRPLSIVRCPEGSSKACFFQKHVGSGMPESVKIIPVPNRKSGESENYLAVDSVEGLVGLAQMGVLEIHSWGSKEESLNTPDQIVIDLDPDASIDWKTLAGSAQELRKYLRKLGLESFLKCTGGKGLHVVVPIRPEHEWPVVKEFAHAIVRRLEEGNPELYVTTMSKAVRKNHIYLDYLRNDREATAIAPFSPRARAGIPVAIPLEWKELNAAEMPVFRVSDFTKWKARLKRDPWAAMSTLRQRVSRDALRITGVRI